MKRFIYSITAVLLAIMLLVGCSAEVENSQIDTSQIESVEESSRAESVEESSRVESVESSEIIAEESSTPEEEESVNDKFAGIASFDTEFNEENVIYYGGYMVYERAMASIPGLHEIYSQGYSSRGGKDDDWFIVAFRGMPSEEFRDLVAHIGAIEITDHPFLEEEGYFEKLSKAESEEERRAISKERYEKMYPNAEYGKDPDPGISFPFMAYFTKPMIKELSKAVKETSISFTIMPEIGNNECWFKYW